MDRGLGCFMRKIKANFVRNIFILLVHAVFLADIFARDVTEKKVEKMQSLQNRMEPLTILFVDHERIVFGVPASQKKSFNSKEYGIKISFSINKGPISAREIFVTGIVNKIYQNEENDDICVDFRYSNMQEEDLRFLYEKATSTLFD